MNQIQEKINFWHALLIAVSFVQSGVILLLSWTLITAPTSTLCG